MKKETIIEQGVRLEAEGLVHFEKGGWTPSIKTKAARAKWFKKKFGNSEIRNNEYKLFNN